jgi:hypothetical protein
VASAWAGGLALSSAWPAAAAVNGRTIPVPSELDGTAVVLHKLVTKYAALDDDGWALMHAIRAMGDTLTVKGESAVDLLCARFLKEKTVAGKRYLYMPVEIEGHTNTCLKTLLEAGVSPHRPFQVNGHRYTVGDLIRSAKGLLTFDPRTFDRDDLAWTLIALSRELPPTRDAWTNAYGQQVRMTDLIQFGFDALDDACRQLQRAKRQGMMPTGKDAIHGFTCGGTHLIYGLASCVGNGYRRDEFAKRLQVHLDLLIWRLEADGYLMERFYRQSPPSSGLERIHNLFFHDGMMKFYGHSFEILSYVNSKRLFTPTADQTHAVERAGARLAQAVKGIEGVDLFEFRKTDLRLFHLLVGDACHAYHGIHMAPGVNAV